MTELIFIEPVDTCEYVEKRDDTNLACEDQAISTVTLPQKNGKKIRVCYKHRQAVNRAFADIRASNRKKGGIQGDAAIR